MLARLADGADRSAWDEFHDRYGELLRRFARSRGLQPADCDDVVQDVLLSLTRALPGFEYDPARGSFRAYLKAVTLRAVSKAIWQKRGVADLDTVEGATRLAARDQTLDDEWEAEWQANHTRRAMRLLEAEFKRGDLRAFQRYALEGHDARETAAVLQMTVNQVYQAKSRILKRLTELVRQQVQEEG